jgi:hypothetical protein
MPDLNKCIYIERNFKILVKEFSKKYYYIGGLNSLMKAVLRSFRAILLNKPEYLQIFYHPDITAVMA